MTAKVLFIGLDSADKALIQHWCAQGELPTLARLLEKGTRAQTLNPPGLFVGAIWPSFYTGCSAARHGRFAYRQLIPGTYETREMTTADIGGTPFWRHLSEAGKKVGIIDVPKSRLTRDINGFHFVDWGTHDADFSVGFHGWPEELAEDIRHRYGTDPVGPCDRPGRGIPEFRDFTAALLDRVKRKGALSRELLGKEDWDFFATVFGDPHCVGHQCWHIHDAGHPGHSREAADALGDPLWKVYKALDAEVGKLIEAAGPEAKIFVLASHGMRPNYAATYFLDDILRGTSKSPKTRGAIYRVLNQAWEFLPLQVRDMLKPLQNRVREDLLGGDRATRACFQIPNNGVYGGIRVNLKGREPNGTVSPGAELDALYQQLIDQLSTLINPRTGEKLVRRLWRLDEWYGEGVVGEFPDFFVEWNRDSYIDSAEIPGKGVISVQTVSTRTGDHENEGLLFVDGCAAVAGEAIEQIRVEDLAPTFCRLLGVELAAYDGKPIEALLR